MATSLTLEKPGAAAPPAKSQRNTVSVNDGQTLWTENTRRPGDAPVQVLRQRVPARGGLRLGGSLAAIDSPYSTAGLKAEMKELGEWIDLKLVGKGSVAGRPTTTIEFGVRAERLKGWGEPKRAATLARSVAEMDDATGAALALKDFSGTGEMLRSLTATEVKANAGLDKKLFAYSPPEGAEVTDLNPPREPAKPSEGAPKAP
jgi:hypothetical protein